jgi:hypothetical protein
VVLNVQKIVGSAVARSEIIDGQAPRVRKFAERYIRSLDRAIAAEQRRAEEGIEPRKHTFDPDGD